LKKKTKKWKEIRLFRRRWRKELKRRKKRSKNRRFNVKQHSHNEKLRLNISKIIKTILRAEEQFSIRDNPNETIDFLNEIQNALLKGVPVHIDVSKVKDMTVDALLYLLALIDNMKFKEIPFYIKGNLPQNAEARDIFVQSGFLNYVNTNTNTVLVTKDCVQIYDGRNADSAIAKKLCSFAINKLEKKRTEFRILYNIIMEIIINTKQHAYNVNTELPKWYAYARYSNSGIDFSILDTGFGIPSTVRKDWFERLNELIANIPILKTSDSRLLKSVTDGEFRTKTKEKYRGKGIPMIAKQNDSNYINDLTIVSNRGYIMVGKDQKDLITPLRGTLYYWRIE